MEWWKWVLFVVLLYLACGVAMTLILGQTPYADNPLWAKLLLWPGYLVVL